MSQKKPQQKLVSFADSPTELARVSEDMENGWSIINLVRNGSYYVGIMEYNPQKGTKDSVFIPPRKKIKISAN